MFILEFESLLRRPGIPPLTFIDLKTTGPDPEAHEIVEIGLIRVDPKTLEVQAEFEALVAPQRLEVADPDALGACGFAPSAWAKARSLREVLAAVFAWIDGAVVAGHHVAFDWAFLEQAFRRLGLARLRADHPRIDTVSLVWPLLAAGKVDSLGLHVVAEHLRIDRPRPYRALADARCALEIARRLRTQIDVGARIDKLVADEKKIVNTLVDRMIAGQKEYGPWHVDDGRNNPREALLEVVDALNYVGAELVRQDKAQSVEARP
ncbi:3'-5' exonuclease [Pendulispora brunnea]|uniref:3'-5' exonuclease n=1 Tax=Pendulispora brunnea TaxID=2905690 RepID=A0ABZ2KDV2_9BACT